MKKLDFQYALLSGGLSPSGLSQSAPTLDPGGLNYDTSDGPHNKSFKGEIRKKSSFLERKKI